MISIQVHLGLPLVSIDNILPLVPTGVSNVARVGLRLAIYSSYPQLTLPPASQGYAHFLIIQLTATHLLQHSHFSCVLIWCTCYFLIIQQSAP